jgi:hypothetical protein
MGFHILYRLSLISPTIPPNTGFSPTHLFCVPYSVVLFVPIYVVLFFECSFSHFPTYLEINSELSHVQIWSWKPYIYPIFWCTIDSQCIFICQVIHLTLIEWVVFAISCLKFQAHFRITSPLCWCLCTTLYFPPNLILNALYNRLIGVMRLLSS